MHSALSKIEASRLARHAAFIGFYLVCAAIIFAPKICSGYVLAPEDDFVQNYPAFASGGVLWTPLLLSGFPILADPQVQFFYPLAWLFKILPLGKTLTLNFSLYVACAFVLASYLAALLARRLTGSFFAGLIGGMTYGFSGYLISELKHVQVLHTALWLPLIFLLIENLASVSSRSWHQGSYIFALAFAVAMMIFAGHPQTATYVLAAAGLYALWLGGGATSGIAGRMRPLLILLPAVALGTAIAAAQLLPSMELSAASARISFGFRDFIVGQVEPSQLAGFCIPYLLGGAYGTLGDLPFSEQGPPPGLLFVGFGPLLLGLYAIVRRQNKSHLYFFCFLLIFSLLLSLGSFTPLAHLIHQLPVFGSFRGLYRVLILLALSVAMLASLGAAQLEKDYINGDRAPLAISSLGWEKHFFLTLYCVICCFSFPLFWGSFPLLLYLLHFEKLKVLYDSKLPLRQIIIIATIFGVICSYGWNGEWIHVAPRASEFSPPPEAAQFGLQCGEAGQESYRILTIKGIEGVREQLPPNLSRLWKVPSATGYEPLVSRRYSRLLRLAEGGFIQPPWHISGQSRAFDIAAVKFIFAPAGPFDHFAFDDQSRKIWQRRYAKDETLVYENTRVQPRFYAVPESVSMGAEEILKTILSGQLPDGRAYEPGRTVLLESDSKEASASDEASADSKKFAYEIIEKNLSDEKLVFKINMSASGYFVLADLFYPGWYAKVDGQSVPILPANFVQRAVSLTKGGHTVVFFYKPKSVEDGVKISVIAFVFSLLGLLGFFFRGRKENS